MKLKTTLGFLVAILLLAAVDPRNPLKGQIRTFYSSQNKDTMSYYYDAEGRLFYYTGARGYKTSYEYKGNTVIETTVGGSVVTMYLNSRGLVDSLTDIDLMKEFKKGSPQKGVRPTRSFPYTGNHVLSYLDGGVAGRDLSLISKKFVYDAAGFLVQETEYVNGQLWAKSMNTIDAGNISSYTIKYFFSDTVIVTNPTANKTDTKVIKLTDRFFKISYDTTKHNSLAMDGPFGKCSKNLAVRIVDRTLPLSNDSTVYTYNYTFDNSGRASSLTKIAKSSGPAEWNDDEQLSDICSFTYY